MSILPLCRVTLFGVLEDKCKTLEGLQALGCMHLVPLAREPLEPESEPPRHAVEARKALRYLLDMPERRRQVHEAPDFDMAATVARVLDNRQRLRQVQDRCDTLVQRALELAPWGDFHLPSGDELGGLRLWFYILPSGQLPALRGLDLPWQVVHRDNSQAWLVVLHESEPDPEALPVPRTHTGELSLSEVERLLEQAEIELEDILAERESLTRWIYQMLAHMARAEDKAGLGFAASLALESDPLFAVQGWAPQRDRDRLAGFALERGLALLAEAPGSQDQPPTMLVNPQPLAAGEDLTGFYQMPAYRDWDPSGILFFSFALFFAMILSDAGYAALLSLLPMVFWRRLGRNERGRHLRTLGTVLAGASLVWGVLVGSYFGIAPPPNSLAGSLKVLDIEDFETMMHLSVGIGVLHLAIANGQQAWLHWGRREAGVHLGWIAAILGGLTLWSGLRQPGILLVGFGLTLVFWLGGSHPADSVKGLALRLLQGLRALAGVTKIFGDVLSYLRLFALGLASASLALTCNDLARQEMARHPGIGLLLGLLILLVGHALNLALGIMSGVVHGLRLNFIEFYDWGIEGEGYPFKAFRKKELRK
jgi:V/A-type H+/Na+-transporting ATPase subunit I